MSYVIGYVCRTDIVGPHYLEMAVNLSSSMLLGVDRTCAVCIVCVCKCTCVCAVYVCVCMCVCKCTCVCV